MIRQRIEHVGCTETKPDRRFQIIDKELGTGLVRVDRRFLHPRRDSIPIPLEDEAVPFEELAARR